MILCLLHELGSEYIPHRTRQADGRIRTAYDTRNQRKGKLPNGRHAEHFKCCHHEECGQGSKDTSGKCLRNTSVYKILQFLPILLIPQILTDTVKDNDSRVDGITHDRQHTCNKGIAHGYLHNRIECKHYKHIVNQSDHGACAKTDIFKSILGNKLKSIRYVQATRTSHP